MTKNPYAIVKHRHVTEKATVLGSLKDAESNRSVRRCQSPKAVFIVDPSANKHEIAEAVEQIYPGVKVQAVNTITTKPKKRRVRGRLGMKKGFKKAIVTLTPGDKIGDEE